jgi:hypothetical protein
VAAAIWPRSVSDQCAHVTNPHRRGSGGRFRGGDSEGREWWVVLMEFGR